jgi:hypothetical protein
MIAGAGRTGTRSTRMLPNPVWGLGIVTSMGKFPEKLEEM